MARPSSRRRVASADEPALATLIIAIATINVWNRLNVTTRQVPGEWAKSAEARSWLASDSGSS